MVPAWANHSTDSVNCSAFGTQEDAQDYARQHPGDPDRLDADNDGLPCEELPHRVASTPIAPTTSGGLTVIGTVTTVPTLQIISESPVASAVRGQVVLTG